MELLSETAGEIMTVVWSEILLILCAIFAILLLIRKLDTGKTLSAVAYLLPALLIIFASDSILQLSSYIESFRLWVMITATVISLVFLLLAINELKPEHLRLSDFYNFIPVLALPIFFFLMETGSLLNIVIMLLQGTGLVVLILFGFLYASDSQQPAILIAGVLLMLGAFIFQWFGEFDPRYIKNIVYSAIGVSTMLLAYSIPSVFLSTGRRGNAL